MNTYIEKHTGEYDAAIEHFKKELANIRTGRANTILIENIQIEAYDAFQPLNQLASLGIADASTMTVEPWDKSVLKDVERGISKADMGFSVTNTGEKLIVKTPPMTEDSRKEMTKILGEKAEETKITIRQIRDKVKEEILEAEKSNELTEDDRYQFLADLDNSTSDYVTKVEELQKEKSEHIMTV